MKEFESVNPMNAINFNLNYVRTAVKKTNITSRREMRRIISEELELTPQDIGKKSVETRIENIPKNARARFIDIMT